jgi:hypothetical protein
MATKAFGLLYSEVPLLSVCWGVSSALVVIMEAITCSRHLWDDSRVHI